MQVSVEKYLRPATVTYCRYCNDVVAWLPGQELRVVEGLCSNPRCVLRWRERLAATRKGKEN